MSQQWINCSIYGLTQHCWSVTIEPNPFIIWTMLYWMHNLYKEPDTRDEFQFPNACILNHVKLGVLHQSSMQYQWVFASKTEKYDE